MNEHIDWFKSSHSQDGNACVETSKSLLPQGKVPVKDSKGPDTDPYLVFEVAAFTAFIADVKDGRYDL